MHTDRGPRERSVKDNTNVASVIPHVLNLVETFHHFQDGHDCASRSTSPT